MVVEMSGCGKANMRIVPLSWRAACAYIASYHRHHKEPRGQKLAIGVRINGSLCGVATMGRPNARAWDDGTMAEVTRTCTDGTKNANSCLYGALRRIAKEMGYDCLITYTEEGESGVSLRAAGWRLVREVPPRKNWANSSQKLRHLRDADIREDVTRYLWEGWYSGRFPKESHEQVRGAMNRNPQSGGKPVQLSSAMV